MQNRRNQNPFWNVNLLAIWSILVGSLGMMGFHEVSPAAEPWAVSLATVSLTQNDDPFADNAAGADESDPFADDSTDSSSDATDDDAFGNTGDDADFGGATDNTATEDGADSFGDETDEGDAAEVADDLDDPFGDGVTDAVTDAVVDSASGMASDSAVTSTASTTGMVPNPAASKVDTTISESELESASVGVRALLLAKPEKPEDLIRIGKLLSDIDASAFGIRLLQRVQAMNLDETALKQLGETLTPEVLLAIGTHPELQPVGKELATAIQKAYESEQQTISIERIESLFATLLDDGKNLTPAEAATISQRRTESLLTLQRLGDHLIPYLLERLTREREQNVQNAQASAFRQVALDLITQCGEGAIPVFAAAFDSDQDSLKLTTLDVLGEVRPNGFTTMTISASQRGGELFVAGLGSDSVAIREATVKAIRQTGFPTSDPATMAARLAQTAENYLNTSSETVLEQEKVDLSEQAGAVQASQWTIPRTAYWVWDAATQRMVSVMRTAAQQRRCWAIRYAEAACTLEPTNPKYQTLSDIMVLEDAIRTVAEERLADSGRAVNGAAVADSAAEAALADQTDFESIIQTAWERMSSRLVNRSIDQLVATADRAMELRQSAVVMVVLKQLVTMPEVESTLYRESGSSVWVRALAYPDPRLRWVAVEALWRIAPSKPYAQSFLLPQTLAYFANAFDSRKVVVVGFSQKEMEDYRRYLVELGYECETAATGNELMRAAQDLCDAEVIFVAASVGKPTADFLLPQIRRDARLGSLPVAIIAEDFSLNRATLIAAKYPWTQAFVMPADVDIARSQTEQLLSLTYSVEDSWRPIPAAQRQSLAVRAVRYLGEMATRCNANPTTGTSATGVAAGGSGMATEWDLSVAEQPIIQASSSPEMVEVALPYLSERGTATCQQALLRIAESDSYPESVRRAAITGLDRAIALRTILLTRRELQEQYDRFNAVGPKEPANRAIRAAILDTLEKPLAQRKEKRN